MLLEVVKMASSKIGFFHLNRNFLSILIRTPQIIYGNKVNFCSNMTVKGLIKAKNDIYMVKRTTLKKKFDGKFFQHFFEIFLRNSAEINPKFFLEIFRNFHIKKLTRNLS